MPYIRVHYIRYIDKNFENILIILLFIAIKSIELENIYPIFKYAKLS